MKQDPYITIQKNLLKNQIMSKKADGGNSSNKSNCTDKEGGRNTIGEKTSKENFSDMQKENQKVNFNAKQNPINLDRVNLTSTNGELLQASMMLSERVMEITRTKATNLEE